MMMVEIIQAYEPMFACPPPMMMALSMVMSAAGTVISYMGQKQAADEQTEYQAHLADLQREAGQRKSSAIIAQSIQHREAVSRQKMQVGQEAAASASMSRLSAIEGGVAGLSVGHLLGELEGQEAQYMFALDEEQRLRDSETERVLKDTALGTYQQISATLRPVSQPSALAAGLQFGSEALATVPRYMKYKGIDEGWVYRGSKSKKGEGP